MKYTTERIQKLLYNSTASVWPVFRVHEVDGGGFKTGNVVITVPEPDGALIAAAPELAKMVINQAGEIQKLRLALHKHLKDIDYQIDCQET